MKVASQPQRRHWPQIVSIAIMAVVAGSGSVYAQDAADKPAGAIEPPFAWNRTDRYEPPNFEKFFPDDAEAGRQLDELLRTGMDKLTADQRLSLIRRGLRRMSGHRTTLLGSVGNQFVWDKNPQDPRAIELLYHASAAPEGEIAHYALYHGPTVVTERSANLVRMLMERYQSLGGELQGRIAWGMKTYGDQNQARKLLDELLDDHAALDAATVGSAIDVYRQVFDVPPPEMERFAGLGKWVVIYYRTDLSSDHPRAAEILREPLEQVLRNRQDRLADFVTRVHGKHEAAVVLLDGVSVRTDLVKNLSSRRGFEIVHNEMLSPRTLQELRVREFARQLPGGLPKHAKPTYTRPPTDETYAHLAAEFVPPHFEAYFADDTEAGARLDEVYAQRESIALSDRELLQLFRRGVRRSKHSPNTMFGWIAFALGWPQDPRLTEILYQGVDPQAPPEVRKAAIYYGFGLGTTKTKSILEAMFRDYMAPPFDRTTNANHRARILWGVRDHEDDKHYLAMRFAEALKDHANLSDQALKMADHAYRQLTGQEPANAADYADRGVWLLICLVRDAQSVEAAEQRIEQVLGPSEHRLDAQFVKDERDITAAILLRGRTGLDWAIDKLQAEPKLRIVFADLLTRELLKEPDATTLRKFEKHLPDADRID
jgi:hypothetical protein